MKSTTSSRNRWGLVAAVLAVAVVAGVGVAFAARDGGDDSGSSGGSVPADALAGAGTDLGDGLEVAPGSSLIGPVVVTEVDDAGDATSWSSLVMVEDDPLQVWNAYAGQMADRFPDTRIDASQAPGCAPGDADMDEAAVCGLEAHDDAREVDMTLVSVRGDVTGRYLLGLHGEVYEPSEYDEEDDEEIPTGASELPEPHEARERPGVGEPLAPVTTAYDGDEEYVVVDGSELLAQYGAGSITGGFGLMLRVGPEADLERVVDAYLKQADQYDDTEVAEETPPPDVTEHEGTTVSQYHPPGGAGGYTGDVTVVDRPEGDDYILFDLSND